MNSFSIDTKKRFELIDITNHARQAVRQSGIQNGLCVVFCPHTTAGITINENADSDVVTDLLGGLERIAPESRNYRHSEGNSDAHIKSSLVGCSKQVIIDGGELVLGTWQGIYFCEFDGPRTRKCHIQIIG